MRTAKDSVSAADVRRAVRQPNGIHLLTTAMMGTPYHLREAHGVTVSPGRTHAEKRDVIALHQKLHRAKGAA